MRGVATYCGAELIPFRGISDLNMIIYLADAIQPEFDLLLFTSFLPCPVYQHFVVRVNMNSNAIHLGWSWNIRSWIWLVGPGWHSQTTYSDLKVAFAYSPNAFILLPPRHRFLKPFRPFLDIWMTTPHTQISLKVCAKRRQLAELEKHRSQC